MLDTFNAIELIVLALMAVATLVPIVIGPLGVCSVRKVEGQWLTEGVAHAFQLNLAYRLETCRCQTV